jgi:hypothetical protein
MPKRATSANNPNLRSPDSTDLYDLLLAKPKLAALAFKLFSGAFESFPETALLRAVDAPGVEFDALLRALATAGSPSHIVLHRTLITKLIGMPLDLFSYREMAKILAGASEVRAAGLAQKRHPNDDGECHLACSGDRRSARGTADR